MSLRHVLFLVPTLGGGGAERVIVTLLRHLDRSRFRLSLAVVESRGAAFREEIPPDVEFIDLNAGRVRYALARIVALIWRMRPDVVFSTLGHLNLALALLRFLLPRGVRTIARETIVVSCSLHRHGFSVVWSTLYRLFYNKHDRVVCQSKDMYNDLVENYRVPPEKALVIHNPVDVERVQGLAQRSTNLPRRSDDVVNLVAAGRLDYQKGFDLLIDSLAELNDPSLHLTLLGKGPLESVLKEQVLRSGLADRVHFAGFQANPYAWFAQADAFVLSSRYEGFPNVVLEAMACRIPVIAMPAPGGISEMLDGLDECVVAEAVSAKALAQAIRTWLQKPRRKLGQCVVDSYRVERIVRKYETILTEQ